MIWGDEMAGKPRQTVDKTKRKSSTALNHPKPPDGFRCTACGKKYAVQYRNFFKCPSKLFAGNDNYMHICSACMDTLYVQLTEFYNGDERSAMDRICMMLDLYYSDSIFDLTTKSARGLSRVGSYISKIGISKENNTKTYNDTIIERLAVTTSVSDEEDLKIANEAQEIRISQKDIDTFGYGYSPAEYADMRALYKKLKGDRSLTSKEEIDLVSLCTTHSLINRSLASGDTKNYISLTQLYQDIMKAYEARFKQESAAQQASIDPVGVMIRTIEQYTPAEYYADKTLFKDADGIGEYFDRFIKRPLKNIFNGTKEMDPEYCVRDGEKS